LVRRGNRLRADDGARGLKARHRADHRRVASAGCGLLALLAAFGGAATAAADPPGTAGLAITAVAPPEAGGDRWMIYLDGMFDAAAATRLAGLLAQERITRADVYFNSPGGSLLAAMAVGRLIRGRGFDTQVGRRSAHPRQAAAAVCYSACPFAYAGGVRRFLEAESVLGVHEAANRVPVPDESAFQRLVDFQATQYLGEMGVSPALLVLMRSAPHDGMRLLDREEAVGLGLVNAESVSGEAARGLGAVPAR
jgi:hypothetical protein